MMGVLNLLTLTIEEVGNHYVYIKSKHTHICIHTHALEKFSHAELSGLVE